MSSNDAVSCPSNTPTVDAHRRAFINAAFERGVLESFPRLDKMALGLVAFFGRSTFSNDFSKLPSGQHVGLSVPSKHGVNASQCPLAELFSIQRKSLGL